VLRHILAPLDGSPLAECALPHAVAVARAFDARVTLLRVLTRPPAASPTLSIDPLDWHLSKTEATAYLDELALRLRETGLQIEGTLEEGNAAERIIDFAHGHAADLLILSSHGRSGLTGWNMSSVVQKVVLRAYMPTMIVRAYGPAARDPTGMRYRRLLVPLDGSQRAECVLPLAATLAQFHGAQLLAAHVVCRPEMPRRAPLAREDVELADQLVERNRMEAAGYFERLRSQLPCEVQTRLLINNSVAAALRELVEQEKVDLVLLSAHGYSGGSKWPYGSVALSLITYCTTPLLVVQDLPPDELESTAAELAAGERKGH